MSDTVEQPTHAETEAVAAPSAAAETASMEDVAAPAPAAAEANGAEATPASPQKKRGRKPKAAEEEEEGEGEGEEEEDEGEAAAPSTPSVSRRGRERRPVQSYIPSSPIRKSEGADELVIEDGPGMKVGDIENCKHRLDITKATEAEVKLLFHCAFPKAKTGSAKHVVKKHIRAFSGYVPAVAKEMRELATEKLDRYDGGMVKSVAFLCDVSPSGSKADVIARIVDFLTKPHVGGSHAKHTGAVTGSGKKRKSSGSSSSSKKKKERDPSAPKRKVSSFILFSQHQREKVKAKHPELAMKEVASKLGEMWRALPEAEKEQWKVRAEEGGDVSASGSESEEEEERSPKRPKTNVSAAAEAEAPPMAPELEQKMNSSIAEILAGADLASITLSKVREALAVKHGELVIDANKDRIRQLVLAQVREASGAKQQ